MTAHQLQRRPLARRRLALLAAAPVLLLPVLTACGGGGGSADSASAASGSVAAGDSAADDASGGQLNSVMSDGSRSDPASPVTEQTAPAERAVVSTGRVRLTSKDVGAVRDELDGLLKTYDGYVADERTETDRKGRTSRSTLTLRLPSDRFGAAMAALGKLGRLVSTSRSAEDVTTQVIDVQQRIRAQEVGLRRLEVLMGKSSSLPNLLAVEREVTRRQAELDSLKSQQKYLSDQTSLATITLSVSRRTAPPPVHHTGFLGGLQNGWEALVSVVRGASVALGAVLPFAAVALVLFYPARLVVRRLRKVAVPEPSTT